MHSNTFKTTALAALAALFAFTVAAHGAIAAGSHSGGHDNDKGHGHSMAIGEPGDPAKADRTIAITMSDNFFEPEEIKIKEGENLVVSIDLDSREYNGRWYTDVKAWKITRAGDAADNTPFAEPEQFNTAA